MLHIEHFSKSYDGKKAAVDDLSMQVKPGEIYGFIGHNGAGKTTTLRCVAGILDFTHGKITVAGQDIRTQSVQAKQAMAFLPDNPDIYPFYTGIQYLNFIADIYSVPREERTELIKKYADMYALTGSLGSVISGYSHGMRQKLALISAFIRKPKLLILDEPFVGLDPQAAYVTKQQLRGLCDEGGAVIFSTHVLEVAEKLCDRVGIIRAGKLIKEGPTAEVAGSEGLEEVFLELAQPAAEENHA